MTGDVFSLIPQEVPTVSTANRSISGKIPAPGTAEIFRRLEFVESRSMHGQLPLVWDRAEDFSVFDKLGNKWIDFTSTIFVANVGHSNKAVSEAIRSAVDNPLFSCYAYANELRATYLEQLIAFAGKPFEKAFLLSAGTEATEAALKLMRMNAQKNHKRRRGIVCIENNWHGRTLGAQMLGSNLQQQQWIGYQDQDIHHIPFPYPWIVNEDDAEEFFQRGVSLLSDKGINFSQDLCGFMLETFQGWGALFYPKSFVRAIKQFCDEHGLLLTFDEMQAGFARTGFNFGYQHYGVEPDLLCVGKGMGGGVPLSGVVGRANILDLPEVGNMSSTHSANPLVCGAGLAVLREIERLNLVSETRRKGNLFKNGLKSIQAKFPDRVSYVLGEGLILAILFKNPIDSKPDNAFATRVAERCMRSGVLVVHTGRESIKLGPPLTITDEALNEGLEVISQCIEEENK